MFFSLFQLKKKSFSDKLILQYLKERNANLSAIKKYYRHFLKEKVFYQFLGNPQYMCFRLKNWILVFDLGLVGINLDRFKSRHDEPRMGLFEMEMPLDFTHMYYLEDFSLDQKSNFKPIISLKSLLTHKNQELRKFVLLLMSK